MSEDISPHSPFLSEPQLRRILNEPDFFRMIFDALPLQVVVKSARPETVGQFLLWNRVAEEWLGVPAAEAIGRTDFDFFPPAQAAFFRETDREVMRSRKRLEVEEEPIQSVTQGVRIIHTIKTPIYDEAGEPLALMAVSEDITERKRTAAELDSALRRMSNERDMFHSLLDHLPVSVFAKSARPENFGTYILWNRVMEELHGRKAAEALGRRVDEIFDPKTAEAFERQDRQVLESGHVLHIPLQSVEYEGAGPRLMRTVKAPVFDADGAPLAIVSVAEDITERIHHEAERAQAIEMLNQINSRVPGAIYKLKVDGSGGCEFIYVSERIEEIYGIPAEEFLANHRVAYDSVFPDDVAALVEAEAQARASGKAFHCKFRVRTRPGEIRWVHSTASRQATEDGGSLWSGFIMDITEHVRAEEALRESEERWELALTGTEAGVWDWNLRTGRLFLSDRWREMLGRSEGELPRTPQESLDLVHPDDRRLVRARTRDLLRRRVDLFRCEYRMRRSDGDYLWILAHAKAHFDADGRAKRMIGTLIDITDRKRVEAQLVEAKVAAENANRAKGDFLAMMSHEIRTPLNGVLGFAELLTGTPLDARQADYLQTIRESGSNLLHVLNDILDYSKIESGRLDMEAQPVALREVIESSIETYRAKAAAKRLELVGEVDGGLPGIVLVDAHRLRQVLGNLISNAVKFTARGEVRVRVEAAEPRNGTDAVPVHFSVSDTGIGIPAEDLPRLFEPFEQLDASMTRRFGGTGLGLSIVRRLVEMMGGRIFAESQPGSGTVFHVDLPLPGYDPATAAAETPPETAGETTGPLSVLLVEDHPVNRRLARFMLERLGFSPDEAADGARAVDLAGKRFYDVILMDIQMPVMDGYEAARRIRRIAPDSQILALTAHAMPADRERSAAHGMLGHLTKPFRIEDLRAALAECATRASQRRGKN